jgi:ubiquinone/menaquinone biosynthesis C-methylase UbiE
VPDFGRLAERYDELRPAGERWRALAEVLVAEGDLAGRRVLDVGCGTGRLLEYLAGEHGVRGTGVDATPEMLAVARRRLPAGVRLAEARAESLPFADGAFERATMTLVVHLLDRPRAFAEARRVLAERGRLVVATFDPAHFPSFWLNRFFPSLQSVDEARFPRAAQLETELAAAGYAATRTRTLSQSETIAREEALEKVRGRHISTFQLLSAEEYTRGLARAESGLPDEVDVRYEHLVVTGEA